MAAISRVLISKTETRAFYDKISRFYDLLADRSEGPVRKEALRMLAPQVDESILEIGPGTGGCLTAIAALTGPAGRAVGVDLSMGMLSEARRQFSTDGKGTAANLICGDATCLPLKDGAFDAVLMTFTLELFDTGDIPVVLSECRRALKADGRMVVAALSRGESSSLAVDVYEWTHRHFPNLLDCRPIFASESIAGAGFAVQQRWLRWMWVPVEIVLATRA